MHFLHLRQEKADCRRCFFASGFFRPVFFRPGTFLQNPRPRVFAFLVSGFSRQFSAAFSGNPFCANNWLGTTASPRASDIFCLSCMQCSPFPSAPFFRLFFIPAASQSVSGRKNRALGFGVLPRAFARGGKAPASPWPAR
jgi:hypothetical protein